MDRKPSSMENMVNKIKINLSEFSGKKVFVTGHTGFKGSWLVNWLHSLGAIVKGYSLEPESSPNLYSLICSNLKIKSIFGDINDRTKLTSEILSFQPDFIFHLAAQPLVRKSYVFPIETFQTNSIGTANILDSLRQLHKPCVCVLITTDKVYRNNEWDYPYREIDALGGYDPYSSSKACAELIINAYRSSYFNPNKYKEHDKILISARAGNVIGGGDWSEDRLVPDIVRAISNGEEVVIRNPKSVRPWQHVLEPLMGYLQLALLAPVSKNVIDTSNSWNFGPDFSDNISVENIVKMAVDVWQQGSYKIMVDPSAPHEAKLLKLDISKAINSLDWKPLMSANQAVELTIKWYKDFYNGENPEKLIQRDIEHYNNLYIQSNTNLNG